MKKIKVPASVKPIHYSERKAFDLYEGGNYYCSFGGNEAQSCKLINIDESTPRPHQITVEIQEEVGRIVSRGTHTLRADELGRTPEEAVINQVTS